MIIDIHVQFKDKKKHFTESHSKKVFSNENNNRISTYRHCSYKMQGKYLDFTVLMQLNAI